MCDVCPDIDGKIAHYQKIIAGTLSHRLSRGSPGFLPATRVPGGVSHPEAVSDD